MSYITKEIAISAIRRLKQYENAQKDIHETWGLNFREDTGRRNALLSRAQEKFFAQELTKSGTKATDNGKTGQPDIIIEKSGTELECKLTSGSGGSWSLQADYSTLKRKKSQDFLYVLADENFESFAVLYFDQLDIDDFHNPAPGSRQKARMNKSKAMKKCKVLVGEVSSKNENMINSYAIKFQDIISKSLEKVEKTNRIISEITAPKKINTLEAGRDRFIKSMNKKLSDIAKKKDYWISTPSQFSISLERIL